MIHDNSLILADLAVTNAYILTLDGDFSEYQPGLILIRNGKIEYVGPDKPYSPLYKSKETIDARGRLVLPAFFNGHNHAGMSIYRGLGNDLYLDDWLTKFVWPYEAKYTTPENVYLGTLLSVMEMVKSGTSIFVDMYFFAEEVARACEEIGMRVVVGEAMLDFPTPHFTNATECYNYVNTLVTKFKDNPLVDVSVPAHAVYSCSDDVLKHVIEIAKENNLPATIHLAETRNEFDRYLEKYGKTSTQYLADLGFFEGHAVAYHCNYLTEEDKELLRKSDAGVVTITHSNMKLASGICPVTDLLNRGIPVAIGTDGPASNNNLSVLSDMRTTALLQKANTKDPTVVDTHKALRMATLNGAITYKMDHRLGSIEKGKDADLIIVDTDQPHWQPMHDPYSNIVYSMHSSDVDTTIINGEIIVDDKRLTKVDEGSILNRIRDLKLTME